MGGAIIMGRKTFESIGRTLPGRQNIIISRDMHVATNGAVVVNGLQAAYNSVEPGRGVFVIGGGQIYELAIDSVERIIATEVDAIFKQADIFFPKIDSTIWREESREHHSADDKNRYNYDFVTYVRR
jgi:dihydrofolate reductase